MGGGIGLKFITFLTTFFRTSRIEVMVEPDLKEVERKLIVFLFLAQRNRDIESFYLFVLPKFKTKKINSNEGLQPKKR